MIINKEKDASGNYRTIWQMSNGVDIIFKTKKAPTLKVLREMEAKYMAHNEYIDIPTFSYSYAGGEGIIREFVSFIKDTPKLTIDLYKEFLTRLSWTADYSIKSFIQNFSTYVYQYENIVFDDSSELGFLLSFKRYIDKCPEKRLNRILFGTELL